MKRRVPLLACLAITAGSLVPARAAAPACAPPRCKVVSVPIPSGIRVPDRHVTILLPAGYTQHPTRRYPVLYLLHGVGDTYQSWNARGGVAELTSRLNLIVVMPDAGRSPEGGWYSDWKDGSRQWETYHTKVLVRYVDSHFRTLGKGHRAIAGFSMGGFGAMHDAARHPGLFAAAATFSGMVDSRYLAPLSGIGFGLPPVHDYYGTPDDRVWGNQLTDEANWRANNPTDLAAKLHGTPLFIATGNGLPGGKHDNLQSPAPFAVENFIWQMNLSFIRALDAAKVPHTDWLYGSGAHDWPYWHDDLKWALPQIMKVIG